MAQKTRITNEARLSGLYYQSADLGDVVKNMEYLKTIGFSDGVGDYQINQAHVDIYSQSAATIRTIDLYLGTSGVTDPFGRTLQLSEVKIITIKNKSSTDSLFVGGGLFPAYSNVFTSSSAVLEIQPLGVWSWVAPLSGSGIPITSGNKNLRFNNTSVSNSLTYDLVIGGVYGG